MTSDAGALPHAGRVGEQGKDGQHESGRLAGARLGNADQVMPGENLRDGFRLDWRRLGVTGLLDCFENIGAEIESTKGHRRKP